MPEQYYDSPLSGQQLDAAFQQMQGIEQTASRVQSNASAAAQSASQAAQSASDAEDAAARAEQIADFNPADFATAAQGEKADTAVQPDALDAYALKTDIPDELPNPQALTIQLGSSGSPTTYDGSTPQALTVTPEAVGAAPEPLTGNLDDVTPAQVREAIQAGRQVSLLKDDNILSAWVDTGLNVQCLYGWNIGSYTGRSRAISLDGYYGDPNGDNTWNVEKLYGNVLPEVTTAQNGKTVTVQNGQWQLREASAGGGGEYTLIANTGLTSMNQGTSYNSAAAAQYDLLGIVCLCRGSTAADEYSQIQWFPVPESGQSRKYGLVCMNVAEVGSSGLMGEAQTRVISITNNGRSIRLKSESAGYYYNWGNKGQDNTCAVPAFLYGMKF